MARNDNFFNRLTQLFRSGPSIQRRVKGYDYRSYYDNELIRGNYGYRAPMPFGRENSPFSMLGAYGILDRTARYAEFAEMEFCPEIACALNIFADETVAGDEKGKAFHLYSKNPEVKKALDELFYDILNIDFNLRPWVRNLVKYGDLYLYNEIIPDIGIVNVQPIRVNEIEREEGFDPDDPYAVRFKWLTRGNRYLENWQITHMRILGNDNYLPYGSSILDPARRVWRQLTMMEDSMLTYRVVRSPERRVFYIDVANMAPNDIPSYMEAVKQTMRSTSVVDRSTGRQDQRHGPIDIIDDYWIAVRGSETGTKIETLAGGQNTTAIDDVKYLQQKMFAAIQVPKPYLNFDENLSAKASLAQQDVRFSRTISVLQRVIIAELNKLAMIHLYTRGFDGEDLINFELKLSNPSTVAMQQKLEAFKIKFEIAGAAKETLLVDEEWIQKRVLELSEDEIIKIEAGRRRDKVRAVEIEAIAVAENLPQQNTTVDPFDKSNYQMSGGGVEKNAPVMSPAVDPGQAPVQASNQSTSLSNVVFGDEDQSASPADSEEESGGAPITATPFLTTAQKKKNRRVTFSGKNALSMPDFKNMLSANNRYMTDISDKGTLNLKGSLSEILSESTKFDMGPNDGKPLNEDFVNFKASPVMPGEMMSILRRLEKHIDKELPATSSTRVMTEITNEIENNKTIIDLDLEEDDVDPDSPSSETKMLFEAIESTIEEAESKVEVEDPNTSLSNLIKIDSEHND